MRLSKESEIASRVQKMLSPLSKVLLEKKEYLFYYTYTEEIGVSSGWINANFPLWSEYILERGKGKIRARLNKLSKEDVSELLALLC